jgi:hypothetical protein
MRRDPATCLPDADKVQGEFVSADGETWYRIDGYDRLAPFFVSLASDSDLWAFVSTAGSLTAGRRDERGAFLPYETVDRIHRAGNTPARAPGSACPARRARSCGNPSRQRCRRPRSARCGRTCRARGCAFVS